MIVLIPMWRVVVALRGFLSHPKDSEENERNELKEMPLVVVVGIEQDQVTGEIGIHQLEGEGRCQGSKERSPHDFVREIVGDLETWMG